MRKSKENISFRQIFDLSIYCIAVLLLFFSAVLFLLEFEYVPQEAYSEPPPPPPTVAPSAGYVRPSNTPYMYNPTPTPSPTEAQRETQTPNGTTQTYATDAPKRTQTPEFVFEGDYYPVKLYFIEQKVVCDIKPVGFTWDNKMGTVRSAYDGAWLAEEPYAVPGEIGKAIIAGHNRWGGKTGTFSVLKKMKKGDTVAVEMNDGYAKYFTVDECFEVPYNDNSVMYTDGITQPQLVLITCKGDWSSALRTSETRVVVICSLSQ